jgi:hypothetical protein
MISTRKSFPGKLALLGLLLTPNILVSQSPLAKEVRAKVNDDNHAPHLHNTEEQADLLASSRLALTILQEENACSTWFRHFDPEVVSTFLSLNYHVEKNGPQHVIREKVAGGDWIEHGPYIARTIQAAGPGAIVTINGNGAFFRDRGDIYRLQWPTGMTVETGDRRVIHVGPYQGGTLRAQIITLLHELAHVVDAIPEDDSSKFGPARSQRNTDIIVQHCKRSVDSLARSCERQARLGSIAGQLK